MIGRGAEHSRSSVTGAFGGVARPTNGRENTQPDIIAARGTARSADKPRVLAVRNLTNRLLRRDKRSPDKDQGPKVSGSLVNESEGATSQVTSGFVASPDASAGKRKGRDGDEEENRGIPISPDRGATPAAGGGGSELPPPGDKTAEGGEEQDPSERLSLAYAIARRQVKETLFDSGDSPDVDTYTAIRTPQYAVIYLNLMDNPAASYTADEFAEVMADPDSVKAIDAMLDKKAPVTPSRSEQLTDPAKLEQRVKDARRSVKALWTEETLQRFKDQLSEYQSLEAHIEQIAQSHQVTKEEVLDTDEYYYEAVRAAYDGDLKRYVKRQVHDGKEKAFVSFLRKQSGMPHITEEQLMQTDEVNSIASRVRRIWGTDAANAFVEDYKEGRRQLNAGPHIPNEGVLINFHLTEEGQRQFDEVVSMEEKVVSPAEIDQARQELTRVANADPLDIEAIMTNSDLDNFWGNVVKNLQTVLQGDDAARRTYSYESVLGRDPKLVDVAYSKTASFENKKCYIGIKNGQIYIKITEVQDSQDLGGATVNTVHTLLEIHDRQPSVSDGSNEYTFKPFAYDGNATYTPWNKPEPREIQGFVRTVQTFLRDYSGVVDTPEVQRPNEQDPGKLPSEERAAALQSDAVEEAVDRVQRNLVSQEEQRIALERVMVFAAISDEQIQEITTIDDFNGLFGDAGYNIHILLQSLWQDEDPHASYHPSYAQNENNELTLTGISYSYDTQIEDGRGDIGEMQVKSENGFIILKVSWLQESEKNFILAGLPVGRPVISDDFGSGTPSPEMLQTDAITLRDFSAAFIGNLADTTDPFESLVQERLADVGKLPKDGQGAEQEPVSEEMRAQALEGLTAFADQDASEIENMQTLDDFKRFVGKTIGNLHTLVMADHDTRIIELYEREEEGEAELIGIQYLLNTSITTNEGVSERVNIVSENGYLSYFVLDGMTLEEKIALEGMPIGEPITSENFADNVSPDNLQSVASNLYNFVSIYRRLFEL